jgi:hypothetical protein
VNRSSTIKGKVYKYVHYQDVYIVTNLIGHTFSSPWLEIQPDGRTIVKGSYCKGYAWDGCSPKYNFLDFIIGTPDGRFDYNTGKQITYYASMIHDALYENKSKIPLSRKEVDLIFKANLRVSRFRWTRVYYFFVRLLGWYYGKWKTSQSQPQVIVYSKSW